MYVCVCAGGINSYECDCSGTGYNGGATCVTNIDDCVHVYIVPILVHYVKHL
jgi:hypothetical protein